MTKNTDANHVGQPCLHLSPRLLSRFRCLVWFPSLHLTPSSDIPFHSTKIIFSVPKLFNAHTIFSPSHVVLATFVINLSFWVCRLSTFEIPGSYSFLESSGFTWLSTNASNYKIGQFHLLWSPLICPWCAHSCLVHRACVYATGCFVHLPSFLIPLGSVTFRLSTLVFHPGWTISRALPPTLFLF